jgi:hypothetical protein
LLGLDDPEHGPKTEGPSPAASSLSNELERWPLVGPRNRPNARSPTRERWARPARFCKRARTTRRRTKIDKAHRSRVGAAATLDVELASDPESLFDHAAPELHTPTARLSPSEAQAMLDDALRTVCELRP